MQFKPIIFPLLVASSMAMPSTHHALDDTAVVKRAETLSLNDATALAPQKQKQWQAAGGCKRDWDDDNRCKNQCKGEASSKCRGWDSVTFVFQTQGCFWGWKTCQCVCEY
jgi:hypothetical protein